jgi:hypothetical protein
MNLKRMLGLMAVLTLASGLYAQSRVRAGSYEVGGFLGASYGIDEFRWMGGGNVTYALNKWILPYAEYSYFPGIPREINELRGTERLRASYNVPLSDFHGGVHLRFPIREYPIVPYGVFGVGAIHAPKARVRNPTLGGTRFDDFDAEATTDAAVNFGGGLRYYITQRYGIRAEAKVYKPTGRFSDPFGKVEFGFFFQLR